MIRKKATIFGASGLIGKLLLQELIKDSRYDLITVILRRPMHTQHLKIKEIVLDVYDTNKVLNAIQGTEVFCCVGTTIKKAGSQEAFRKVDFDLPVLIGKVCKQKEIEKLFVVSSLGADANSGNFYLRTKGEMEQALTELKFQELKFFRPSMLLGDRSESRPMESIGKFMMKSFGFLFIGGLKKYKAISAKTVARAMVKVANTPVQNDFIESNEIELLGN